MARFELQLPTEIMRDFDKIHKNADHIFGEMTRAGAEVVESNMRNGAPDVLKPYIKLTKTYKTPTDDGINTKSYISGYIPFSNKNRKSFSRSGGNGDTYSTSKGVPADFLAKVYEYGRSGLPFPKHPFVRKAFKKGEIEQAMLKAQKIASGGLLDE